MHTASTSSSQRQVLRSRKWRGKTLCFSFRKPSQNSSPSCLYSVFPSTGGIPDWEEKRFFFFVFQPTSGAGMSFSPIVTVGTETAPLLAGISRCALEPAWTGCVSDHLLLVFHMYPISEARNPVLRNQKQEKRLSSASK